MRKTLLIAAFSFVLVLLGRAQSRVYMDGKPCQVERWITRNFGRGQLPPFSFLYDGKPSTQFITSWKHTLRRLDPTEDHQVRYLATYSDPKTHLRVECEVKGWTDFGAIEWVLRFENQDTKPTPQLSRVQTLDLRVQHPRSVPTVYFANGSNATRADFAPHERALPAGDTLSMHPLGGRSSDGAFPFYNIETSRGEGIMVAIGWTGTWTTCITSSDERTLSLDAGLMHLDAALLPAEKIRVASVCVLFWQGEDRMAGHNRFRRYMLAHHSRKVDGRPVYYPFCGGFNWGDPAPCNEYTCMTTEYAIALMQRTRMFGLTPECFWLDAGWYTEAADYLAGKNWANTTGNWIPDPERFPATLKPIGDYAKEKVGSKFMVWFEPERVFKDTRWDREHPEWMLQTGSENRLFNLSLPEAREWMSREIGDILERNSIDYYRQDFNIAPEGIWLGNDTPGRKGITEVKYIEGLYAFWDYLLQRFPSLLIDNCASGGRRLDYETMLRSAPLWRTDYNYGEPVGYQCHTYGLEFFLSQHGTGCYHVDPFDRRSSLGSAVVFNWKLTQAGEAFTDMAHTQAEYLDVRPYFYEDFYPLSGVGDLTGDDIWLAYQLHRPSDQTGYIVAFRRAQCPAETYEVRLSAVEPTSRYLLKMVDGDWQTLVTGKDMRQGLTLSAKNPRSGLLIRYTKQPD